MPIPDYGALPLAKTFLMVRALSFVAMIGVVGMTANFVSEIVSTGISPPQEIVGTLSIVSAARSTCLLSCFLTLSQTSIAALYCLISVPFFYSQANLGLFIMTGIDGLLLISFIVIAVVVGKPVSFLNCPALFDGNSTQTAAGTAAWVLSLVANVKSGGRLDLYAWAGSTKMNCYVTKAIWGLCIALW